MKIRTRALATGIALALGATIAVSTPAQAKFVEAGGGTWDQGITLTLVWSNYIHTNKVHRSSVTTEFDYRSSPWTKKGVWSYASTQASVKGNKTNWDVA